MINGSRIFESEFAHRTDIPNPPQLSILLTDPFSDPFLTLLGETKTLDRKYARYVPSK
jgi:hypothetical protein